MDMAKALQLNSIGSERVTLPPGSPFQQPLTFTCVKAASRCANAMFCSLRNSRQLAARWTTERGSTELFIGSMATVRLPLGEEATFDRAAALQAMLLI